MLRLWHFKEKQTQLMGKETLWKCGAPPRSFWQPCLRLPDLRAPMLNQSLVGGESGLCERPAS